MKICPYCVASIEDTLNSYTACGKTLEINAPSAQSAAALETADPAPEMANPVPVQNPQPKKKTGKVVLIVVLAIVLVLVLLVGGTVLYFYSLIHRAETYTDTYWQAYEDCDGAALTESVPDAYWDYIAETYGYTEAECLDGVTYYMEQQQEALGEPLTISWERTGVSVGLADNDTLSEVQEQMEAYDLDCSLGAAITMDAMLEGADDSESYTKFGLWAVKIDGAWYNASAMHDIETACEEGYVEMAQYQALYLESITTYWNAFYASDLDTMSAMMPDVLWDFLETQFGVDQSTVQACMQQYIADILYYSDLTDNKITFEPTITSVEAYDKDEIAEINAYLGNGLSTDVYEMVAFDYVMTADGESIEDSSASVMMQIDDTWYLYDGIYYFIDACYYYMGS